MKTNILRGVLIILLLCMFYIIFGFSNQNGETSGSISRKITLCVTKNISHIQNLEEEQKEIVLKRIEKVIRKMAHFSLYTVIGILMMSLMSTYNIPNKRRIIISFIVGLCYAGSDEFHQLFIQGRSAQITDVLIDSCGVGFGILIMLGIKLIKQPKNCWKC